MVRPELIATKWLEAFNAKDLDALLALYADDCRHTSPKIRTLHPETGGQLVGKAKLRAWWKDAFDRLPGLRYQQTHLTADEQTAVLEYLRRVPGEADLHVAEVFECRGGRIVSSRVYHG